jgi:dTDP-L-rhamnose 4-epimerase
MSRIKNDRAPIIYEDGLQSRDFISVHDIVKANLLAMENASAHGQVFNVGTGNPVAIKEIAEILAYLYGKDISPEITHTFRKGDVRHCYADITKIRRLLGFQPEVTFEKGLQELIQWSREAPAEDRFEKALRELKEKKLV